VLRFASRQPAAKALLAQRTPWCEEQTASPATRNATKPLLQTFFFAAMGAATLRARVF
jgi:hypothetical protein